MQDIKIITNMLNNYSRLPDFIINRLRCYKHNDRLYHIYFSDSINFRFSISLNQNFKELANSIYTRYLDESYEPDMRGK